MHNIIYSYVYDLFLQASPDEMKKNEVLKD